MQRSPGRKGAFHVELPAIEHVQLEHKRRSRRIDTVAFEVLAGLLQERLDCFVERGVILGELLGDRRHELQFLGRLVDVDDVHRGRAVGAKNR